MDAVNDVPRLVDKKGSLTEKWLTFSQGLRNTNHTQTLDLANIYKRFINEDNLIQIRYSDTKKALITTPSSSAISIAFFFNNVIQDFQENSDDEVDERSSEEYLRDLEIEYHERSLLANLKRFIKRRNNFPSQKENENTECYKYGNKGHFARGCFSKTSKPSYESLVNNYSSVSKGFQPKFTPKLIQTPSNSSSHIDSKLQKDYKTEYKKMKAKLSLFDVSSSGPQNPKTFQPKNKCLVAKIFDWDKDEVFGDEEVTQVKVLMALVDDELTVRNSHARNGEWVDITIRKVNTLLYMDQDVDWQNYLKYELLSLKQAKLDAATFQIQNIKFTKLNHALQEQLKEEKMINEKWLTSSKKVSQCISEQVPHEKKVIGGSFFKFKDNAIDLSTSISKRETMLRGGVLAESSQSSESSIRVKCNTCGSTVHSTSDHNEFDHFKIGEKAQAAKAREPTKKWDHLGKFDAKAGDGYFLGYSSVSKAFRVYNTRRQQIEETYHVTFNESMEAIRFTNTSVDEIGIHDSSRYHPDEFFHKNDPSR
nr:retrovirus-related Pol polyprotein from transposon TNT 1-94 [Tanacetum cinerariifolium]